MTEQPKPTEMTYRDYRERVETAAEVAIDIYGDDYGYNSMHDTVHETIDGSNLISNYGYMLATVLLSDQNPDTPDYCEPWDVYADLTNDPSWSDAVGAMAYVCYYSDVYEQVDRMEEQHR